jgi:hypothetical protein
MNERYNEAMKITFSDIGVEFPHNVWTFRATAFKFERIDPSKYKSGGDEIAPDLRPFTLILGQSLVYRPIIPNRSVIYLYT